MQIATETAPTNTTDNRLAARWAALRKRNPRTRIRDGAAILGVSEAELLAEGHPGRVRQLDTGPKLLEALTEFGPMMALTRNEWAVHEKTGEYRNVMFEGPHGLVLNHDIDLRIFPRAWRFAFAVETDRGSLGTLRSIQFFSGSGEAIHKVYVKSDDDLERYETLVGSLAIESPEGLAIESSEAPKRSKKTGLLDLDGFYTAWRQLKDTHDFFPLMRKHGLTRLEALMNAPEDLARPVAGETLEKTLEAAAADELPIMVFVGNPGCIQIHTGPVANIRRMGTWLNVLDQGFNLHLNEIGVASTWLVRKPTEDGVVTSLEIFDAKGQNLGLFFGERKPGIPELEAWRELLDRTLVPA